MCGICGFIQPGGLLSQETSSVLRRMSDQIAHRGPDDAAEWIDARHGVAFGHRRLAIVDLSPAGRQPMRSASGRYVIVFNGEIYNHLELREALGSGWTWRGRSDTESLLAAFEAWGVEETLRRAVGMFAFALWDAEQLTLVLARDRFGEKPLYYGRQGNVLLFGSELKALRAHPAFEGEIDQEALAAYLKYGYVPAPHSIYRGVHKLPPGSLVTFRADAAESTVPTTYWNLEEAAEAGARTPFDGSDEEAVDELERLLERSIRGQLMSDVPLGAFLSGGIDSSTVVALMQGLTGIPVKSFTVGFSEGAYDESAAARDVARHLGTDHTELIVTPQEAQAVLPKLPDVYDEPFGDASAIPTFLVAGLAKRSVTVALSGDGGDELFAGYGRYRRTSLLWERAAGATGALRSAARLGLDLVPDAAIQRLLMHYRIGGFPHLFSDRVRGLRTAVSASTVEELYDLRMAQWPDTEDVLRSAAAAPTTWAHSRGLGRQHPTERMMAFDIRSYMPDDVLVKVDRAAMAHSLETRVPLLDHRLVEFAWSVPHHMRVRDGDTKWLLRQLLYRHMPPKLVNRPKQGFGVPIADWLRGPLRPWAEELLSARALQDEGPFVSAPIRALWEEHLSGRADWEHRLWPVLMYQAWAQSRQPLEAAVPV